MRHTPRTYLLPVCLCLSLAAPGLLRASAPHPDPAAPGLSPRERLEQLLARVEHEQRELLTLRASFVQHKTSGLLAAPEESRGEFLYANPDRVRWEFVSPSPMRVVINGNDLVTWYRDLGRAERLEVGQYSAQVFKVLGAGNSLATLQKYFDVTAAFPAGPGDPYRLDLDPRYARIEKRLAKMSLWIDSELFLPRRLRYEEPDGDVTEYVFETLEVNAVLPEQAFDLDLPADVEVRTLPLERGR